MIIAVKENIDFRAAITTPVNPQCRKKMKTIQRFQNDLSILQLDVTKCKKTTKSIIITTPVLKSYKQKGH